MVQPRRPGVWSAADVAELGVASAETSPIVLEALTQRALRLSRPTVSGFAVGAAVRASSGTVLLGFNLEFAGLPLGWSVHAEQAAAASAFMRGEAGLIELAASAAPCGHCRQFLFEMAPELSILVDGRSRPLREYLPDPFAPSALGVETTPIKESPERPSSSNVGSTDLKSLAEAAAQRAWSPYTNSHSGVALSFSSGATVAGSYLESAAFNPSLSPLLVALIVAVGDGLALESLERAVLVERRAAVVQQAEATRDVLSSLGTARLDIVPLVD